MLPKILKVRSPVLIAATLGCQQPQIDLTVYSASSLTEAVSALEVSFETSTGKVLATSFSGSHLLRFQIEQGAPADIFVSANPAQLEKLVAQGMVVRKEVIAYNELVLIVPHDNPAQINVFKDLVRAKRVVIGTEASPIGLYTRRTLAASNGLYGADFSKDVYRRVVSHEGNVRLVRAKVVLGQADAAIVYRSDAMNNPELRVIEIPQEVNVRAEYVGAVMKDSVHKEVANGWLDYILSEAGQALLRTHGFVTPS